MSFDTVLPADSVEFCPHPNAQDVFVCGTYNLEAAAALPWDDAGVPVQQPQRRTGRCMVFEIKNEGDGKNNLRCIQEISLPAIPDMKWCHTSAAVDPVLGVADSEGHITLYNFWQGLRQLYEIDLISCVPSDVLCLSLDWSSRRCPSTGLSSLIVSLSNGSLCLLRPGDQNHLLKLSEWRAHDYESWIAAWDYWHTDVIYSGGDDLKLKGWDVRQPTDSPIFVNKRFDGGVTSIQSHPYNEYLLAVGSYDQTVRLFDTRKPLSSLHQVEVGGGAWRVKWHPSPNHKHDLLVACMHDGFKIVRFRSDEAERPLGSEILKRFDAHKSLAYGVDWSHATGSEETPIVSCSFYDHSLHLWSG